MDQSVHTRGRALWLPSASGRQRALRNRLGRCHGAMGSRRSRCARGFINDEKSRMGSRLGRVLRRSNARGQTSWPPKGRLQLGACCRPAGTRRKLRLRAIIIEASWFIVLKWDYACRCTRSTNAARVLPQNPCSPRPSRVQHPRGCCCKRARPRPAGVLAPARVQRCRLETAPRDRRAHAAGNRAGLRDLLARPLINLKVAIYPCLTPVLIARLHTERARGPPYLPRFGALCAEPLAPFQDLVSTVEPDPKTGNC